MSEQTDPLPEHCVPATAVTLVAGPCSAETRDQIFSTAGQLAPLGLRLFRAGLWKPRTQPGSFEGVGAEGLPWLIEVQQRFGLRVATEVCLPEHVRLAAESDLDAVWLGARTVANPYAVQALAESLASTELEVWVKNPISPDVQLWLGAIERLERVGKKPQGAIFRGFKTLSVSPSYSFRNTPYWSVAFELKRLRPELEILCDPSHITGERRRVGIVAQQAIEMGFDGLMVECHITPEKALSDARQQVTPAELSAIMAGLYQPSNPLHEDTQIADKRALIAELDEAILSTVAQRMAIAREIGFYKKQHAIPILQADQFHHVLEQCCASGARHGLDTSFVHRLFSAIHEESVRQQTAIEKDLPSSSQ